MRINEPRSPVVMERGHSKSIRDASSQSSTTLRNLCLRLSRCCCACWTELNGGTG